MRGALALALAILVAFPVGAEELDPETRRDAQEAILIWRAEARANAAALDGCELKLATRTPTVSIALTVPPAPVPRAEGLQIWPYVAVGAGAALVGLVAGLVTGVYLSRSQP